MTEQEQIQAAKNFSASWNERGKETSESQIFWITLFRDVFGIAEPEKIIKFEQIFKFGRIDALIPSTKVLIEHKSYYKDLLTYRQKGRTAFQQAKFYYDQLNFSERPRWIVTCNFQEFHIYDMYNDELFEKDYKPQIVKLENLDYDYKKLKFLVDPNEDLKPEFKISKAAADIVSKIYEHFDKSYNSKTLPNYRTFLNAICIRFVFCFYAGDSHLFSENQFSNYINKFPKDKRNDALQKLFAVLNIEDRANIDDEDLKKFPYVNGGLFNEKIILPNFDTSKENPISAALYFNRFKNFSWHTIHPAIFGSLFEGILGKEERRAGGMHYTGVENIHKVINPLFLDELHDKFKTARNTRNRQKKIKLLRDLQDEMAQMIFFDPACGCGNFLTETYISLRMLENQIIRELYRAQVPLDENPVKIKISQFFGVDINDYAAAISQLAIWISENQMLQKTVMIIHKDLPELPLSKNKNIFCKNALQIDWNDILPIDKLQDKKIFIIGNPPFVGGMMMTRQQKSEMLEIWGDTKGVGEMDYVSAWYKKAVEFIKGTKIEAAFVSTNSIIQGQQALTVWKPLFSEELHINFAHRTFKWTSDSDEMAAVHCVVISFSFFNRRKKFIFDGDKKIPAKNINSYLLDAPNIFIEYRSEPLCPVPEMHFGSMPRDGGNLIIQVEDYDDFIKNEPAAQKYIRPYIGADEFINGKKRYCLWLVGVSMEEIFKMPLVAECVEKTKNFRLASKAAATRKFADIPHLFCQIAQPNTNFILIPRVSSENRRYIPMGFMTPNVIASDAVHIIPDATIYHFGILISSVHMAWTRAVCGRLEMRYRYSKDIVYNNFVWCSPTVEQRAEIERTAQKILDVLAQFENWTLAKLYNEDTMPAELRAAHLENNAAVLAAYGFDETMTEPEIVSALFKLYHNLTGGGLYSNKN